MIDGPQSFDDAVAAGPGDDASDDGFAMWDGAYVLGALDRADRLKYEAHLADCPRCRASVTELSGLPGLLAQVDTEVALALVDPNPSMESTAAVPDSPPDLLARVANRAWRQRRRRRLLAVSGAVAAAAAAVAIAVPVTATVTDHPAPAVAEQVVAQRNMDQVRPSPITASFEVYAVGDGSRIEMACGYAPVAAGYNWTGTLWVVRADGGQSQLAQWTATAGQTVHIDGTTDVPPGQLRSVEIRSAATNEVMLTSKL